MVRLFSIVLLFLSICFISTACTKDIRQISHNNVNRLSIMNFNGDDLNVIGENYSENGKYIIHFFDFQDFSSSNAHFSMECKTDFTLFKADEMDGIAAMIQRGTRIQTEKESYLITSTLEGEVLAEKKFVDEFVESAKIDINLEKVWCFSQSMETIHLTSYSIDTLEMAESFATQKINIENSYHFLLENTSDKPSLVGVTKYQDTKCLFIWSPKDTPEPVIYPEINGDSIWNIRGFNDKIYILASDAKSGKKLLYLFEGTKLSEFVDMTGKDGTDFLVNKQMVSLLSYNQATKKVTLTQHDVETQKSLTKYIKVGDFTRVVLSSNENGEILLAGVTQLGETRTSDLVLTMIEES